MDIEIVYSNRRVVGKTNKFYATNQRFPCKNPNCPKIPFKMFILTVGMSAFESVVSMFKTKK